MQRLSAAEQGKPCHIIESLSLLSLAPPQDPRAAQISLLGDNVGYEEIFRGHNTLLDTLHSRQSLVMSEGEAEQILLDLRPVVTRETQGGLQPLVSESEMEVEVRPEFVGLIQAERGEVSHLTEGTQS